MKNPIAMLKEIKSVLGIELSEEVVETKLAQMMLENGTVLEAEEFAPEFEVFIVTEEDKIALPVGEYALEDGRILVVEEEGLIKEIKEVSGEEVEEEVIEEEMAAEDYATKSELAELKSMIEEIKAMLEPKEEMSEVEELVKEELSKPAAAPIKHSPEGEVAKKQIVFGANRPQNTKDTVMARISQIKK
jgi:hypothetical protein